MKIHKTTCANFRNLADSATELGPGANILVGDNAQGKTSFLEAIYLCATGRSLRASRERDMIRFGAEEAHAGVVMRKGQAEDRLDIHLKSNGRKAATLNDVPISRIGDLLGSLPAVTFSPEDLKLVKSGPGERRRFLDMELCQLDKVYCFDLQNYHRVMKQRNLSLKSIKRAPQAGDDLDMWDSQMAVLGKRIMKRRQWFLDLIAPHARSMHEKVSESKEQLEVLYRPSVSDEEYEKKLRANRERDTIFGSTSIGIHKDDMSISINGCDARSFGSQGQQRTASLAIKMAEIDLIRENKGTSPILLLDDILSELDSKRQGHLVGSLTGIQSIITCTGIEDSLKSLESSAFVMKVQNGLIAPS
ncbi:MAG: DNA replication/repair protein RecF [Clostridiales bacterium]|nr:DNA replication/repair protein RecF [Clostridiales bacterium]MDR2750664.1 DNA replication/repair protein RecF [Clostridiales bacterium]